MYPIYAFIIRLTVFLLIVVAMIFGFNKIMDLTSTTKKTVYIILVTSVWCATIYFGFFFGNIFEWTNIENDERLSRQVSDIAADFPDEPTIYEHLMGSGADDTDNPIVKVSRISKTNLNASQITDELLENESWIWKNKCRVISGNDCTIIMEPIIEPRFLTTPSGVYYSDIFVVYDSVYYDLNITQICTLPILQPFVSTKPQYTDIRYLLNNSEIRYDLDYSE